MTADTAVLAANAAFYEAFADRDIAAMDALWARRSTVACIHPGWPPLIGRERVMESWRAILSNPEAPRIRCTEPVVHMLQDAAIVVCLEIVDDGFLAATNLFVREGERWLMAHHQAGATAYTPSGDAPDMSGTVH